MPKKAFEYCLKVWVTGVVIGPMFFYVINKSYVDGLASFWEYIVVSFLGDFLTSVPSFLLLWATTTYICKRPGYQPLQRLKLAVWALLFTVLTIVAVAIWTGDDWASTDWSVVIRIFASYFTPIAAAIFIYRLPTNQPPAHQPTT
jgi:hypothetical protein